MRTEKKLQAVDSWYAWRTLQTWLYLNAMILRHIRASLDEHWTLNACDHFYSTAAGAACFNVDIEHALEPLRPGHSGMTFGQRFVFWQSRHHFIRLSKRNQGKSYGRNCAYVFPSLSPSLLRTIFNPSFCNGLLFPPGRQVNDNLLR